jgi:hypothetical protein
LTSRRGELAGLLRELAEPSCAALAMVAHRIAELEREWGGLDLEERTKRLSQKAAAVHWASRTRTGETAEDVAEAAAISMLAIALRLEGQE